MNHRQNSSAGCCDGVPGQLAVQGGASLPAYSPNLGHLLVLVTIEHVDHRVHNQVLGQAPGEVHVVDQLGEPASMSYSPG